MKKITCLSASALLPVLAAAFASPLLLSAPDTHAQQRYVGEVLFAPAPTSKAVPASRVNAAGAVGVDSNEGADEALPDADALEPHSDPDLVWRGELTAALQDSVSEASPQEALEATQDKPRVGAAKPASAAREIWSIDSAEPDMPISEALAAHEAPAVLSPVTALLESSDVWPIADAELEPYSPVSPDSTRSPGSPDEELSSKAPQAADGQRYVGELFPLQFPQADTASRSAIKPATLDTSARTERVTSLSEVPVVRTQNASNTNAGYREEQLSRGSVIEPVTAPQLYGSQLRGSQLRGSQLRGPSKPEDFSAGTGPTLLSVMPTAAGARLSVTKAVQLAVARHPDVIEALGNLRRQAAEIRVAEAAYYPQVAAGVNTDYSSSRSGDRDSQQLNVSLSQTLWDFGKIASRIDAADAVYAADMARLLNAVDEVAAEAAFAAIEVQRYRQLLSIAEQQSEGIDEVTVLVAQRSELGAARRSEEIQAEARAKSAHADRLAAEAELARWQSTLTALLDSPAQVQRLSDTFPHGIQRACVPNFDLVDRKLVPEILLADAGLREAEAQLRQAKAERYPTLSVGPRLSHDLNEGNGDYAVALDVEMPLYQGGANSSRVQASRHALSAAQARKNAAEQDLRQSYEELNAQRNALDKNLTALSLREESISSVRELYHRQYFALGNISLLDVLNAEREIYQARNDRNNAHYDLLRLVVQCLRDTGEIRHVFALENPAAQGLDANRP